MWKGSGKEHNKQLQKFFLLISNLNFYLCKQIFYKKIIRVKKIISLQFRGGTFLIGVFKACVPQLPFSVPCQSIYYKYMKPLLDFFGTTRSPHRDVRNCTF